MKKVKQDKQCIPLPVPPPGILFSPHTLTTSLKFSFPLYCVPFPVKNGRNFIKISIDKN
jgi:hypothetical protein